MTATPENASAEYEDKAEQLISKGKDKKADLDSKQADALDKIGSDDSLSTQTVELGELDMEVKTYLPKRLEKRAQASLQKLEQAGDDQIEQVAEALIPLFVRLTVDESYDETFWNAYVDEYGSVGLKTASKLLVPVLKNAQAQGDILDSFPDE